jgi:small subunit ribosomal protein S9
VVLTRGTGIIKINGDEDFWKRWGIINDRMMAAQPFYLTKTCGVYDCHVAVQGGGLSGQAGAMRLAIARALYEANPSCSADLKQAMALYEDHRQRIPKTDAQPGAYARKSWSKR